MVPAGESKELLPWWEASTLSPCGRDAHLAAGRRKQDCHLSLPDLTVHPLALNTEEDLGVLSYTWDFLAIIRHKFTTF